MSDEDLWRMVTSFAGMDDDTHVRICAPHQSFLFVAKELRELFEEAWAARGREPDPGAR